MKTPLSALPLSVFALALSASAAVPLPWTVETSRVQPASFDAYHGEALEFIARFNSLGKPLALDSHTATLYYQTNGMDQAWWSVPASVSGNVARAAFTPAMDPRANKIVVFIGVSAGPSNLNYRATANVRFLNSPGANPGWIEPPVVKLDFSQIETLNAPWFTKDESNGRYFTKTETNTKIASATNGLESAAHAAQTYQAVIPDLEAIRSGAAAGATALQSYTETDPMVPAWAKAADKPSYIWSEIGSKPTWIGSTKPTYNWSEIGSKPTIPTDSTVSGWGYIKSYTETDPTVPSWAKATAKPAYIWSEIGSKPTWIGSSKPSYTWTEIGSKPTTFTPSTHSHASDSWFTDALSALDSWFTDALSAKLPAEYVGGDNDEYQVDNDVYFAGQVALNMGKVYDEDGNLQDVAGVHQIPTDSTVSDWGYIKSWTETDPTISAWAKATTKPTYNWSEIGSKPTIPTDSTVSGWGYLKSESDPTVDAKLGPVSTTVNAWQTYWSGDDVRVTVTNYYGSQDLPSLYLEQKISEGGTNYFKTIWTEKARLNLINDRLDDLEADVETKADRAWGFYDSHSGTWAPDGFTAISSGSILISKDMSYQQNITSGGEVWVLTSNDPTVISGTETNGFFKIADSEGNSILEVVKGDKRVVPATVSAVSAGGNSLTISYNVVAAQHPSIEICSDLVEADWKAEDEASCPATVAWSGSSGNYVATVTGKAAMPKMFVKGTYEVGGETYIKNSAPLGFEKVVIGGVYYRVTVETVSGRKLMVLTEL